MTWQDIAGPRRGAVRRREEPDPGARAHPARPAHGVRLRRRHHARLQAPWHHDAVRRARCRQRPGPGPVPAPPPPPGVPGLPQARGRSGAGRARRPPRDRQLRYPQARQGQGLAGQAAPLPRDYTPTYASWRNQIERWFGILSQREIRRGSFTSAKELVARIDAFVANHNDRAQPFSWTATADDILGKVARIWKLIKGTRY